MNKRDFARQLRQNSTDAERRLWSRLRDRRFSAYKFRRQAPVGEYIADFICYERRLIIELDGGQHYIRPDHDRKRDAWLRDQGFQVLRFPDNLLFKQLPTVLEVIWRALEAPPHEGKAASGPKATTPHPPSAPSPARGEG